MIERICLLGVGEAGFTLAQDLLELTDTTLQLWDKEFDTTGSAAERHALSLRRSARVECAADAAEAALGCQLVLSTVTADEAFDALLSVLPGLAPSVWFVDFNSVSPGTKQQMARWVEAAGGRFVEAVIMSPIAPKRIASPMLLAGPYADAFESIGHQLGFIDMRALSTTLGAAAAAKMCRSVVVKGIEALVTESLLAARRYQIDDVVLASLGSLFPHPDWSAHACYLIGRSLQHGERRAAEMREVAKTVSEAGVTPWMSEACAERQAWAAQFNGCAAAGDLDAVLDAIADAQAAQHQRRAEGY